MKLTQPECALFCVFRASAADIEQEQAVSQIENRRNRASPQRTTKLKVKTEKKVSEAALKGDWSGFAQEAPRMLEK